MTLKDTGSSDEVLLQKYIKIKNDSFLGRHQKSNKFRKSKFNLKNTSFRSKMTRMCKFTEQTLQIASKSRDVILITMPHIYSLEQYEHSINR